MTLCGKDCARPTDINGRLASSALAYPVSWYCFSSHHGVWSSVVIVSINHPLIHRINQSSSHSQQWQQRSTSIWAAGSSMYVQTRALLFLQVLTDCTYRCSTVWRRRPIGFALVVLRAHGPSSAWLHAAHQGHRPVCGHLWRRRRRRRRRLAPSPPSPPPSSPSVVGLEQLVRVILAHQGELELELQQFAAELQSLVQELGGAPCAQARRMPALPSSARCCRCRVAVSRRRAVSSRPLHL